jgi:hypothetical protein
MALTRPRIGQFNTTVTSLSDPITVLNGGADSANVDVGFLMNRANGLISNVALYWSESGNTFVTAFTSNSGATNSNIAVSRYANITTGSILPGANVTYDIGTPTQRFRSLYLSGNTIDLAGATIKTDPASGAIVVIPQVTAQNPNPTGIIISAAGTISTIETQAGNVSSANISLAANSASTSNTTTFENVVTTGNLDVQGNLSVAGTVTFTNSVVQTQTELVLGTEIVGGNLVANSGTVSTNVTTGALVVTGGAGISGNLNVGGNISANNIFQDRGQDMNDWNTLTVMGVYLINRDSWTGTSNTPLNTLNFTGQLEVINTGNVSITQNYRPYDSSTGPNVFWTRSKYSTNAWTSWVKIINGSEVMDGGSF